MRTVAVVIAALMFTVLAYQIAFASGRESGSAGAIIDALAAADLSAPVLNENFPDPAVLEHEGFYYAFATNSSGRNIPTARSVDLVTWEVIGDAMPELAPWVRPLRGMVWAPEPIRVDGHFLMYYTARDDASNRQCIGVATSSRPEGPYRDAASQPLVCPPGHQRAIDAHPYFDKKQLYLFFSGECCGESTTVLVVKLTRDGLSVMNEPAIVLRIDAAWEGDIIEAPTMIKRGGDYYLFYSANNYRDQTYAVGYAVCKTPLGPCAKARENPVLATGDAATPALGPGHQSLIEVDGTYVMLFHGWRDVTGYNRGGSRVMWVQPLAWQGKNPIVNIAD